MKICLRTKKGRRVTYLAPETVAEALAVLRDPQQRIVAGCTDVFPALRPGEQPGRIVDITRIDALRGIRETEAGWRIGAAVSWSEIAQARLPRAFAGLQAAARAVGGIQIQNRGTIGGNICNASPAADGVPPLLTLAPEVEIVSSRGARRVALERFITGVRQTDLAPGEIMVAIWVPKQPRTARGAFVKLGSRAHLVISIAMVAALVDLRAGRIASARVAVGSCAPTARRLPELEAWLAGRAADGLALAAFDDPRHYAPLAPIGDIRGTAEFRRDVVAELCRRAVLRACGEE